MERKRFPILYITKILRDPLNIFKMRAMRSRSKRNGQTVFEYSTTVILIVLVVIGMSLFIRRALQARIMDAKFTVLDRLEPVYDQHMRTPDIPDDILMIRVYDPYYLNQSTLARRTGNDQTNLLKGGGGSTGVFQKSINEISSSDVLSITAPPKDADGH